MAFKDILQSQRNFFASQQTKDLTFRKKQLKKLKSLVKSHENQMYEAINKDFGKSAFDTFTTEISFIYKDIDFYLKNLNEFAQPKSVTTNLVNQLGNSKIYAEPLGNCLVIGAWNYPYQISLTPLIAAIAAGNTVILKPSELPENSMKIMAKIINENFESNYLHVVEGGVAETTELLNLRFDKIFFTGSPRVGKIVYQAAAKNLTPITLELGGKSPVIIAENANLEVAAKRIIWGKFLNAGQSCVAPDYILVQEKVQEKWLQLVKKYLEKFDYTADCDHYTKIINTRNFDRLVNIIDESKIFWGGKTDREKRYIQPTILQNVTWEDAAMQEEIFGPILPVLSFKNLEDVFATVENHEKPLSAYLFTNNSKEKKQFLTRLSFGGGCINDVVMHLSNDYLPFGGVGNSGMGNYHGKAGFDCFSHQKSILDRATYLEPDLKYPPYSENKLKILKKLA